MAYIQIHQSLRDHRKIIALAEALQLSEPHVAGHCVYLWLWSVDNAPEGILPSSVRMIERAAAWDGQPGKFVSAMILVGMIEETDDEKYEIHDWYEYAGKLIEKRKENTERMRNARASKRATNVQRTCDERAEAREEKSREEKHIQTNKKDHVHSTDEYTSDFETFWSAYPKKLSKKAAFKNWNARLNSGVDPQLLVQCAVNYAELCRQQQTEERFIKHPTTFLSSTESYADYEAIEATKQDDIDRPKFTRDGVPLTLSRHAREAMLEDERQRLSNV